METILQVRQLNKRYRNGRGVRDVSFEVRRGDVFGLFGPNGSGKTTVLKIISGLCRADGGSVSLFGVDAAEQFEQAMDRVGCIVETAEAYDYMSGRDNLKLAARLYPDLPKTRIDEVLEWVRLTPYANEKAGGYSLGMKQRLALAAALLNEPELVILDEPSNGLDIEGTVELRELILRLSEQNGTAFLISSHQLDEMERICSRIGFMYGGDLIREGGVDGLIDGGSLEQAYLSEIRKAKESAAHV
ncbi:ATP-binding cassette domain-containing protein [Paenibacillus mesophilus]|uniref:ABC transporter ATP-binding protein n=1 Tax=Paenibacillus mesophilus TaxID=2582849 RepID=UPI00110F33C6|nr:ATP-binding cassette domain-containing protein [Paenibacillus mesophilus]TMV44959.1 ATP-binding cassette domain-containing protein [Paenibacillus mesophilus]